MPAIQFGSKSVQIQQNSIFGVNTPTFCNFELFIDIICSKY